MDRMYGANPYGALCTLAKPNPMQCSWLLVGHSTRAHANATCALPPSHVFWIFFCGLGTSPGVESRRAIPASHPGV